MTSLSDIEHNGVYLGTNGIALGAGKFKVDQLGNLTATNATLTGTVNATAGKIGGFNIDENSLYTNGVEINGDSINHPGAPSSVPAGFLCYLSTNQGVHSSFSVVKLTFKTAGKKTIYIRSYAETSCDIVMASNLNASTYPIYDSNAYASTSNKQTAGEKLSDYVAVTYNSVAVND